MARRIRILSWRNVTLVSPSQDYLLNYKRQLNMLKLRAVLLLPQPATTQMEKIRISCIPHLYLEL